MEIVITSAMNKKIGNKLLSNYYESPYGLKVQVCDGKQKPIFRVNNDGELITGTIKQVKQCNSCGAVGKINSNCEYCGNIVY